MKPKAFFSMSLMFVFLLICSTGIYAQTTKTNLDQVKLMKQTLGTWETNIGKDTIEVWEYQQYGKSFIINVYYNIKGTKSPVGINNFIFDSKEGKFKGFTLSANGTYGTWIGLWTSEKKLSVDLVQDLKPEAVLRRIEHVFETPTQSTLTRFSTGGVKTGESKYKKIKSTSVL